MQSRLLTEPPHEKARDFDPFKAPRLHAGSDAYPGIFFCLRQPSLKKANEKD